MHDCDTQPHLMTLAQARQQLAETLTAVTGDEHLPLLQAVDRITADVVTAIQDMPPFAASAMDGYALRAADAGQTLPVAGRVLAGERGDLTVAPGHCVRIMTGAPVPAGLDVVVMQEQTTVTDDGVSIPAGQVAGTHVRAVGSEARAGDVLISAGTRLSPRHLGLLASQGLAQVCVKRRVRVGVLSTGDELRAAGERLQPGQIYDSNRIAVAATLTRNGFDVVDYGRVADDPDTLRAVLTRASQACDAVVSSGGVSVGEADFIKPLLNELGHIHFWKLAVKPGKPFAFGQLGGAWFFGLPGNPVSALLTLDQLALPALRQLGGEAVTPPVLVTAKAGTMLRKQPGRLDMQRMVVTVDADGTLVATPAGIQGSAQQAALSQANALAFLERERGNIGAGETISITLPSTFPGIF